MGYGGTMIRSLTRRSTFAVLVFLVPAGAALAFQAIPNLVGHWTLDEAAGPANDSSATNADGTWNGGPTASNLTPNPAISTNCINLDGVDDFVNIDQGGFAALDALSAQISVSAWVNLDVLGAERKVVAKWGDTPAFDACWLLTVYAADVNFWIQPAAGGQVAAGSGTTLSTGVWHHLVGTYDGATLRLYINGIQAANTPLAGTIRTSAIPVRIGAGSGTTVAQEEPVDGRIDDVRIYDRAITPAEVTSLWTTMLPNTFTLTAAGQPAQIFLSWTAAAGATSYEVRRGTSASGPFTPIATVPGAQTTMTDTTVAIGTPYSYLIVATTPAGTVLSNVATATATVIPPPPPRITDHPNGNQEINDSCGCGAAGPLPPGMTMMGLALALLSLASRRRLVKAG